MLTSKKFTWGRDSREAERKGSRDSEMGKRDQGRIMKVVFSGGNCSPILPGSFEVPGPLRLRVMGGDLFISSHSPLVTGWHLSTSRCVQKPREQSRTYRRPPTKQLQVQWYRPHLLSWSSHGQSYRRTRPRRCRCSWRSPTPPHTQRLWAPLCYSPFLWQSFAKPGTTCPKAFASTSLSAWNAISLGFFNSLFRAHF